MRVTSTCDVMMTWFKIRTATWTSLVITYDALRKVLRSTSVDDDPLVQCGCECQVVKPGHSLYPLLFNCFVDFKMF